jgi:zinc/manganese transport system substrate-binding protein
VYLRRACIALVSTAGLLVLLTGCRSGTGPADAGNGLPAAPAVTATGSGRIVIVAAENFWGNIASQIGGDQVTVNSIISDPNADPHEYESSVSDAAAIAHADLVIENGLGYDDFMAKLVSAGGDHGRTVLTVAKIVGVSGSNPNPHLWYDPTYVDAAAQAIEKQLAADRPVDAPAFAANLAAFRSGERQVENVIDQIRARYSGAAVAYTERVPGYLIDAAGLHLGTPTSFSQSIEDGEDPNPLDSAVFEQALRDRTVKVLLYNAQVTDNETSHLKQLAVASGVPVVGVTETMPPGEPTFQAWQRDQATALLTALGR